MTTILTLTTSTATSHVSSDIEREHIGLGIGIEKDCPICMEVVSPEINSLITECGHTFHTSCLLNNVLHNGFGCPYCRRALVEEADADGVGIGMRRRRDVRVVEDDRDNVDIFNDGFYEYNDNEENEHELPVTENQYPAEREMTDEVFGGNWLSGGGMGVGVGGDEDRGMVDDNDTDMREINSQNNNPYFDNMRRFIVEEGFDEWEQGGRIWQRERRSEERAFLGMRIMFHSLDEEEGFIRDREWFDWMDSEDDSEDDQQREDIVEEIANQNAVTVEVAVEEEYVSNSDSEDEEGGGFDEVVEREQRLAHGMDMPSPYDLSMQLQRHGFYIIDYVRIILGLGNYPEYTTVMEENMSTRTLESLRETIARILREYRIERQFEREIDIWRNNNHQNQNQNEM